MNCKGKIGHFLRALGQTIQAKEEGTPQAHTQRHPHPHTPDNKANIKVRMKTDTEVKVEEEGNRGGSIEDIDRKEKGKK